MNFEQAEPLLRRMIDLAEQQQEPMRASIPHGEKWILLNLEIVAEDPNPALTQGWHEDHREARVR